MNALLVYI